MHLLHVHRGRLLLRDFQTAFPTMALTTRSRSMIHTTASSPSLRATAFAQHDSIITAPIKGLLAPPDLTQQTTDTEPARIRVVVRVRQLGGSELGIADGEAERLVHINHITNSVTLKKPTIRLTEGGHTQTRGVGVDAGPDLDPDVDPTVFASSFDHAFWSHDRARLNSGSQKDIFNTIGVGFLDSVFNGINTSVIAYGQSGSGKSYTMMGTSSEPGLIPRICYHLFDRIDHSTRPENAYSVTLSYLHIQNECLRDVLIPRSTVSPPLRLKQSQSAEGVMYDVDGLMEMPVYSFAEVDTILRQGCDIATASAVVSSPVHTILTINLHQCQHDLGSGYVIERIGRIRLVDLVGSDAASSDRSIGAFDRVITALATPRSGRGVIPFRDSVVTLILRSSLVGNSNTTLIGCISSTDFQNSLSTLRCMSFAKKIQVRPVANIITSPIPSLPIITPLTVSNDEKSEFSEVISIVSPPNSHICSIHDFRHQVSQFQRFVDDDKAATDAKVIALENQVRDLTESQGQLLDEIASLEQHVTDVMLTDANDEPLHSLTELPDDWLAQSSNMSDTIMIKTERNGSRIYNSPNNSDGIDGHNIYTDLALETEDWAAEMSDLTHSFLHDLSTFRVSLGHDQARFNAQMPIC